MRQLGGRIAALGLASGALGGGAVEPVRRHVGRIGFQHQRLQRQRGGQAAQLQRTLVGECAAKAQLESQCDKRLRLLPAAVEGVGDAALHRHLAQPLEQAVGTAAHVQDHGQIEAPCQLQLRAVKLLLARRIQPLNKVIQADFAHGHQVRVVARTLQHLRQRGHIAIACAPGVERVDTQRVAVAVALRQRLHRRGVGQLHRRNHQVLHARRPRRCPHRIGVGRELGGVEVAVGVYPGGHGGDGAMFRGWAGQLMVFSGSRACLDCASSSHF